MQLFKIPSPPANLECNPEPQALAERDTLLAKSSGLREILTPQANELCAEIGSSIQKLVKGVESARKELTAPYLAAQRAIKSTADTFCEPLLIDLDRLGRLASVYRVEEERKAEAERQARTNEIARLQEQERQAAEAARLAAEKHDLMAEVNAGIQVAALATATTAAIAAPPPEAAKTAGQRFTARKLFVEVVDPIALWNSRPELCNPPTAKLSAINAVCTPEQPVAGLRLWWESKVDFNRR